ncbi:MAG: TolC family protein [Myxococcota bacterium]|nr:TolC family protein [Myxococcota bacterium]
MTVLPIPSLAWIGSCLALLVAIPASAAPVPPASQLEEDIRSIEELSTLSEDAEALPLDQAVQTALAENLGLRVVVRQLGASRSRLKASWGPWIPYATGGWNYRPFKGERWFDQYKSWERTDGHAGSYSLGVGANLPTGTSLTATWSQGEFQQGVAYDPEIFVDNPLAPDEPIPLLVDNEFQTRWSSLSFTLNQSLLEGISPRYQLRSIYQARVAVERSELEQQRQMGQVVADTLKAYWDLVAARRLVEIQRIDRRLAEEQRSVTEARIAAGELAPVELLRIDETVASRAAELLEAERSAAESEQRLKLLMGVRRSGPLYGKSLRPEDGIQANLPARDREVSVEFALKGNFGLRIARTDLESRRIDWRSARHELLPDLSLSASLALNGTGFDHRESISDVFDHNFPDLEVGMNLRLPLPDLAALHSVRAADLDVEAALLSLEDQETEVLAGVETALRSIESFGAQVEVARLRRDLAAQTAGASQATYGAGRNTLRDVLEAQAALKEARVAWIQAQVDQLKARVDLELLRGSLLETLGVELR